MASAGADPGSRPRSRFGMLLCLVALLAFAIREHYVLATIVDVPIRGDVREYVAYAWNLLQHGVFSSAPPGSQAPVADAFRSPGYPWLLALCMQAFPQDGGWSTLQGWYPLALQLQVVLGTATVVLATLLSRRWLPGPWSLLPGLLLALWPHHITATGVLISETLFGFCLVAATYCTAKMLERRDGRWAVLAGAAFGYAFLTNPVVALFPPLVAFAAWRSGARWKAALLLGVFLLPVVGWGIRNAWIPETVKPGRAVINFVQGSWPEYHDIHVRFMMTRDARSSAGMALMEREMTLLHDQPAAGVARMADRFRTDIPGYLAWYGLRKPWLLWDWGVRIGYGGAYVYEVRNSPLEKSPVLRLVARAFEVANPALALLALCAALGTLRLKGIPAGLLATSGLALYLTAVHVVFQAEPRYAIAYRGLEVILAATAVAWLARQLQRKLRTRDLRQPSLQ